MFASLPWLILFWHSCYPCSFLYLYILPRRCNIISGHCHIRTCFLEHFPIASSFDMCYFLVKILYILFSGEHGWQIDQLFVYFLILQAASYHASGANDIECKMCLTGMLKWSLLGWVQTQSSPLWLDITGMSPLSFPPVELLTIITWLNPKWRNMFNCLLYMKLEFIL